jgi:hypothetical protein
VVVEKAVYGDLPGGPSADVTEKVAGLVKAGTLAIEASNGHFGDPTGGIVKKLRVDYRVDGIPASATVVENETLDLALTTAPPDVVEPLCAALPGAAAPARLALLRTLKAAGGARALEAVRAASTDADPAVRETGLRLLCDWPSADARPDLARLAREHDDPKIRILALRGTIRLAQQAGLSSAERIATLKEAMALAGRDDERKLVLAALGGIPADGALALVTPGLDSPGLKEEAALAAVSIAEKLAPPRSADVADAMKKVADATADAEVARRAKALLKP